MKLRVLFEGLRLKAVVVFLDLKIKRNVGFLAFKD